MEAHPRKAKKKKKVLKKRIYYKKIQVILKIP